MVLLICRFDPRVAPCPMSTHGTLPHTLDNPVKTIGKFSFFQCVYFERLWQN